MLQNQIGWTWNPGREKTRGWKIGERALIDGAGCGGGNPGGFEVPRYQLRPPMEEDGVRGGPGDATERKGTTVGKRVLIYFPPPRNEHHAGIVDDYDVSNPDGNYLHVTYDDGD